MTPHRIHLRGFWTTIPLPNGRVRHTRSFGRPRTLDPHETLWVVCDATAAFVNGHPLTLHEGAFDATMYLLPRNELAIETETDREPTVVLEIRSRTEKT